MSTRLLAALTALSLAGCGARTELADSSGAGGSSSASTTAATMTSTSAGGGGSGNCKWGFGPEVALEQQAEIIGAAEMNGHLVYVARQGGKLFGRSLSNELTSPGAPHPLPITHGDFTTDFAGGHGHAAVIASTSSCHALAIGDDGSALGGVNTISDDGSLCVVVIPTVSGFVVLSGAYAGSALFVGAPLTGRFLGADATSVATEPAIVPASAGEASMRLASAALADGSVVLFWVSDGTTLHAQRFDAQGNALTPDKQLFEGGIWAAALSLGSTMLLAWNVGVEVDTNEIRAATLDASLELGPVRVVVPAPTKEHVIALVDGGPGPGELLVTDVGVSLPSGADQPAHARWIAADGAPIGEPFVSSIASDGKYPILVGTSSGPVAFGFRSAQRVICQ